MRFDRQSSDLLIATGRKSSRVEKGYAQPAKAGARTSASAQK
jgi:hypothetical protein